MIFLGSVSEIGSEFLIRRQRPIRACALDRGDQDRFIERLEQVIHGPQVPHALGIARLIVAGNDNDRHSEAHGRHRLKHIEPRFSGHVKVQQHAVWTINPNCSQKIVAGLKRLNIIAMRFEKTSQRHAHLRFIIQNSDDFFAACHSAMTVAGRAALGQLYLG